MHQPPAMADGEIAQSAVASAVIWPTSTSRDNATGWPSLVLEGIKSLAPPGLGIFNQPRARCSRGVHGRGHPGRGGGECRLSPADSLSWPASSRPTCPRSRRDPDGGRGPCWTKPALPVERRHDVAPTADSASRPRSGRRPDPRRRPCCAPAGATVQLNQTRTRASTGLDRQLQWSYYSRGADIAWII
jgi:hypothetical protein